MSSLERPARFRSAAPRVLALLACVAGVFGSAPEAGAQRRRARRARVVVAVPESPAAAPVAPAPVNAPPPSAVVEPSAPVATSTAVASSTSVAAPAPSRPSTQGIRRDGEERASRRDFAWAAWIGGGLRTRSVTLIAPDGADAGYVAPGFFELALGAEAWFFEALFVRAEATSSAGLRSRQVEPGTSPLDSWFASASTDLGARLTLDGAFELGFAAGVGLDRYVLPFNARIPTLSYAYLRPGAIAAARLLGAALVFEAEAGARFAFTAGELEALYGQDYTVRGFDVTLRWRGVVGPNLLWRVEGGYRAYSLSFRTVDGTVSGRDAGYFAHAHAGWAF